MFVVSILDDGEERNFLATSITLVDEGIILDAGGAIHRFWLADLIAIVNVDERAPVLPLLDVGFSAVLELIPTLDEM